MISFLQTKKAEEEAKRMALSMLSSSSYSFPPSSSYPLSDLDKNTVFAVLLTPGKILRSFSGALNGQYIVPGYVPPCFSVNKFKMISEEDDDLLHTLTDSRERKKITEEKVRKLNSLYSFSSWNGKRFSLPEKCPTGTGDCAGLKAINHALRKGYEILALSEFSFNKDGDLTFFPPCEKRCSLLLPRMLGLNYLYADDDIAVVNKEEGMLSVPGRGDDKKDSVEYRFHTLFKRSIEKAAVNRLDMDTSGLMVLAFTKKAKAVLGKAFEQRMVEKRYIALLSGVLKEEEGSIDLPIYTNYEKRPYREVDKEKGKDSVTLWKRLGVEIIDGEKYTRVIFFPKTGRTHQIRVHSSYICHPIKGDRLYGKRETGERLALHSSYISFTHPITGEVLTFTSGAPF